MPCASGQEDFRLDLPDVLLDISMVDFRTRRQTDKQTDRRTDRERQRKSQIFKAARKVTELIQKGTGESSHTVQ